jgi:hypothetical protein
MTITPIEAAHQARPCPLCADEEWIWGNLCRLYRRPAYLEHCREYHPGIDGAALWKFPMPHQRGRT